MENKDILILGLLLLSIGGQLFTLVDTGTNRRCTTGWEYNISDNKYYCGERSYYCVSIRDSKNTENYYCDEGKLVERQAETNSIGGGVEYICPPPENSVCIIKEIVNN